MSHRGWWIIQISFLMDFRFSRKSTLFELFKFKISLSISVGFWLKPKSHLDFQKWIFKTVSKTDIQNRRFFPVLKIAKKLKKPKKYQKVSVLDNLEKCRFWPKKMSILFHSWRAGMKIHECSCSFVFAVFNDLNGTRVRPLCL